MKKTCQYLQLSICASFIINLIYTIYTWIPSSVFIECPSWCIGQIAIKGVTYGLILCVVAFIKRYFMFKTEM